MSFGVIWASDANKCHWFAKPLIFERQLCSPLHHSTTDPSPPFDCKSLSKFIYYIFPHETSLSLSLQFPIVWGQQYTEIQLAHLPFTFSRHGAVDARSQPNQIFQGIFWVSSAPEKFQVETKVSRRIHEQTSFCLSRPSEKLLKCEEERTRRKQGCFVYLVPL